MNDFKIYVPAYLQQLRSGRWLPVNALSQPLGSHLTPTQMRRAPRTMDSYDDLAFTISDEDLELLPPANADSRIFLDADAFRVLLSLGSPAIAPIPEPEPDGPGVRRTSTHAHRRGWGPGAGRR